jgi:hypothetical protein
VRDAVVTEGVVREAGTVKTDGVVREPGTVATEGVVRETGTVTTEGVVRGEAETVTTDVVLADASEQAETVTTEDAVTEVAMVTIEGVVLFAIETGMVIIGGIGSEIEGAVTIEGVACGAATTALSANGRLLSFLVFFHNVSFSRLRWIIKSKKLVYIA